MPRQTSGGQPWVLLGAAGYEHDEHKAEREDVLGHAAEATGGSTPIPVGSRTTIGPPWIDRVIGTRGSGLTGVAGEWVSLAPGVSASGGARRHP